MRKIIACVLPFRLCRDRSNEYAILKRADETYWQGIAGGGKDGEFPIDAAKREALEETGIPRSAYYFRLNTTASVPVYHFGARHLWPEGQYVIPVYYFAVEVPNVEIILSHEHTEYAWVDYETGHKLLHWDSDRTALWELNEKLFRNDLTEA